MFPFYPYPPFFPPYYYYRRPVQLRTFKVVVNGISDSGTTTDLAIDPIIYRQLPNECMLLFVTNQGIPPARATETVNVVAGTRRLVVRDSQGNPLVGTDLANPTEKQVYLNKSNGTFRVVNYTVAATTGGGGGETA